MKINKKSKILIVGSHDKFTLDYIYYRTFKYLNFDVEFFNIQKSVSNRFTAKIKMVFSSLNYFFLQKKIVDFIKDKKKKYDLIIFFKSIYLNQKTLQNIKLINGEGLIMNIFPDDPFQVHNPVISNKKFLKSIKHFDVFCIWSLKIKKKLEYKFNIKKIVHGGNWRRLKISNFSNSIIGKHIYGNKINKIMNESAISLNILRDQNYTSHNMKTFEIPSNNGLMLTTRSQEQDIFFKENKYCFMYSSTKELNKKIHYIITNPKRAAIVRKNGFNQVKKYSYINRVKNLVKELNLLQKGSFSLVF